MKLLGRRLSGCAAALLASSPLALQAQDFEANGPSVDLRLGDTLYSGVVQLPLEEDSTNVNLGDGAQPIDLCLEQEARAFCTTLTPGVPQPVTVEFEGKTQTLVMKYRALAASFDEEYRAAHGGSIRVEVPPAYELVNVAIALTPYAEETYGLVSPSPYLEVVRRRLGHLRDHPFVKALDSEMREDQGNYHLLKMNGAAFVLLPNDDVRASQVYRRVGWSDNTLEPYVSEMQDFARAARFTRFLEDFAPLYDQQIAFLRNDVDVEGMLEWLSREFPGQDPYDSVRVIFSPLVGYNQSMARFEDGDFRELQPHVNFPYPTSTDGDFAEATLPFWQSLILFTELNHGFINDTTDALNAEIEQAMGDVTHWTAAGSAGRGYGGAGCVFTEMINWALFSVRARDVLPPDQADLVADAIAATMLHGRGFTQFAPVQDKLLALRAEQEPGGTVAELLPTLVSSLAHMRAAESPAE